MTLNKKLKIAQALVSIAGAALVAAATAHVSEENRKGELLKALADYARDRQEEKQEVVDHETK